MLKTFLRPSKSPRQTGKILQMAKTVKVEVLLVFLPIFESTPKNSGMLKAFEPLKAQENTSESRRPEGSN